MKLRQLDESRQENVKIVILCGTLSAEDVSNTVKFARHVEKDITNFGGETTFVQLNELDLQPGVTIKVNGDDGPELLDYVDDADVLIFATPIWWGAPSSLIQRVIERFDEVDEFRRSAKVPKSRWYGKLFGCIVVGEEDGIQAVSGRLYSWATNMGFTIPPDACARMFGDYDQAIKQKFVRMASKQLASNVVTWGNMLKEHTSDIDDAQVGCIGMFQMSSAK